MCSICVFWSASTVISCRQLTARSIKQMTEEQQELYLWQKNMHYPLYPSYFLRFCYVKFSCYY